MFRAILLISALALLTGCKSEVTCERYDFNGFVEKSWLECSDGKKYAIDCDVEDGKFDCWCEVDGKRVGEFSHTSTDDFPWRGLKKKDIPAKASELCGWGKITLVTKE